jgi:hypothetical protein
MPRQPGRQAGAGRPGRVQQVGGKRERQAALAVVAAATQDRAGRRVQAGPEFVDQRRLPASRLAGHHDDLAACPCGHLAPGRGEHAQFHRPVQGFGKMWEKTYSLNAGQATTA